MIRISVKWCKHLQLNCVTFCQCYSEGSKYFPYFSYLVPHPSILMNSTVKFLGSGETSVSTVGCFAKIRVLFNFTIVIVLVSVVQTVAVDKKKRNLTPKKKVVH